MTTTRHRFPFGPVRPEPRAIHSWQDAEQNAAAWMRFWWFTDAVARPGGSDQGIDVWSSTALGQVKYQAVQVGRPQLQNLFGARGLDNHKRLFFFTGSGYARTAIEYADQHEIALFVYGLDGSMTALNEAARRASTPAPVDRDVLVSNSREDAAAQIKADLHMVYAALVSSRRRGHILPDQAALRPVPAALTSIVRNAWVILAPILSRIWTVLGPVVRGTWAVLGPIVRVAFAPRASTARRRRRVRRR